MMHASSAAADEGDVFNVNATLSSTRDNNLFRLAPSVDPKTLGLDDRSETITTTALGLNLNKLFGVQRVIANVNLVDNNYKTNDYLNFLAFNYDAKWLWSVGVRWTGELAIDRNEALNSFADNRLSNLSNARNQNRNVRTTDNERFTANYWFHSDWAAVAGVSRTSLTNEQAVLAESDYEASGYNFGLRYRPISGNSLVARVRRLDGTYENRQFNTVAQYDNGFTQDSYELDLDWRLTGKGQLRGHLEYLDRQHDHFSDRDYAGLAGKLDYIYAYSGKGNLALGYKRGLESYQQPTSSYYILDEVSLATQWAATSKLTASARLGYGLRSYRGEIITLPATLDQRDDKISRLGFDLAYRPAHWIELKAGVTQENRNTNNDVLLLDYKDRMGFLSATAQY